MEPANCVFCGNRTDYCEKWHTCENWVLAPISDEKQVTFKELEVRLTKLDWNNDHAATLEVLMIDHELQDLDVWYRLFP